MSFENVNAGIIITEPEATDGSLDNANAGIVITLFAQPSVATIELYYRTGATQEDCEAASFTLYTGPFNSLGFAQLRVE